VAYVANLGINLFGNIDQNQPIPALRVPCINATGGFLNGDFSGCEQAARPFTVNCQIGRTGPCFPYLGQVDLLDNQSGSNFNSLQVTFTKRYSHGLYLLAGYTYAHAIDTATSNVAPFPQNSLNFQGERGNGDFDIRHRFTLSLTYELPSRESKSQMLKGWQVNSIVTLQGGEPYSLIDFGDDNSATGIFEDRWNLSGSPNIIHWSATTSIPFVNDFTTDNQRECERRKRSVRCGSAKSRGPSRGQYVAKRRLLHAERDHSHGSSLRVVWQLRTQYLPRADV
jgi:hypothetical protein